MEFLSQSCSRKQVDLFIIFFYICKRSEKNALKKCEKFNFVLNMNIIEIQKSIIALYPIIWMEKPKKIPTQKHISVHFICMVEFFERQQFNVVYQQLIHRVPKSRRIYYYNVVQQAKNGKILQQIMVTLLNFDTMPKCQQF